MILHLSGYGGTISSEVGFRVRVRVNCHRAARLTIFPQNGAAPVAVGRVSHLHSTLLSCLFECEDWPGGICRRALCCGCGLLPKHGVHAPWLGFSPRNSGDDAPIKAINFIENWLENESQAVSPVVVDDYLSVSRVSRSDVCVIFCDKFGKHAKIMESQSRQLSHSVGVACDVGMTELLISTEQANGTMRDRKGLCRGDINRAKVNFTLARLQKIQKLSPTHRQTQKRHPREQGAP